VLRRFRRVRIISWRKRASRSRRFMSKRRASPGGASYAVRDAAFARVRPSRNSIAAITKVSYFHVNQKRGRRCPRRGFLMPALARQNLNLQMHASSTDWSSRTACMRRRVRRDGEASEVLPPAPSFIRRANRLAAYPQLVGIGSHAWLAPLASKPIDRRGVGSNLQDHCNSAQSTK